jgi:hypothetical protein
VTEQNQQKTAAAAIGDFITQNLVPIIICLGTVLAFTWNAAENTSALRHQVEQQAGSVAQLEDRVKVLELLPERVLVQARDILALQKDLARLETRFDRRERWYRRFMPNNSGGGK